jgi:hypothetical protein
MNDDENIVGQIFEVSVGRTEASQRLPDIGELATVKR